MRKLLPRPLPVPIQVANVGDIGMLHLPTRNIDALVIVGDGSEISSLDLPGQMDVLDQCRNAIRRTAVIQNNRMGVSFIDMRRPVDPWEVTDTLTSRLHPDIFAPAGLGRPKANLTKQEYADVVAHEYQLEQLEHIKASCRTPTQAAVLTIKREIALKRAARGRPLSAKKARRLLVTQLKQTAEAAFSQYVTNPRVLDFAGVHDFFRGAWDIADSDNYYEARADGRTSQLDSLLHYPQYQMIAKDDHCWTDNTCHTVLRVIALPAEVTVNEVHSRFEFPGSVPWFSRTLVSETINYKQEYRWTNHFRVGRTQIRDRFEMMEDHRSQDVDDKLDKRTQDLYRNRFSQDFSVLIAISATNLEELEEAVDDAQSFLRYHQMTTERIRGRFFQFPALWSATTGIDML